MASGTIVAKPPSGLMRWALRLPIWLYRLKLGGLLGGRFVLINHIGRKSGQTRQTVVEVVEHDKSSDTYYVASGWGYKSQWYQNVMATPEISIQVGWRKLDVRAETLSPEAGRDILLEYRQKHKFAAKELSRVMGVEMSTATPDDLKNIVRDSVPMIAFRPRS